MWGLKLLQCLKYLDLLVLEVLSRVLKHKLGLLQGETAEKHLNAVLLKSH